MAGNQPRSGGVLLMVGTCKGAFLFWSDPERKDWGRSMHHPGWMVHHMDYDARDGTLYAATNGEVFGALVQRTQDFGATWQTRNEKLDCSGESERRVRKVWHIEPILSASAGQLYAGAERAGVFRSENFGQSWTPREALNKHEHSEQWQPGAGGLILHTIVLDPTDSNRIYMAIWAAGVYRSDDGGETWHAKNRDVRADFLPDRFPEFGQCIHKLALHPSKPEMLYQQNCCGVYRSDDRGDHWTDISEGLPSRFGFPLVVNAHDPDTVYVIALASDSQRMVADDRWRGEAGTSIAEGKRVWIVPSVASGDWLLVPGSERRQLNLTLAWSELPVRMPGRQIPRRYPACTG